MCIQAFWVPHTTVVFLQGDILNVKCFYQTTDVEQSRITVVCSRDYTVADPGFSKWGYVMLARYIVSFDNGPHCSRFI